MSPADALDPDAIGAALRGQLIGNRIVVLEETTSTNDVVSQMASDSREGLVVFAEMQTAGRGQYGRGWESAAYRGLWFSILLRPRIRVSDSGRLTDLLASTVAETLEDEIGLASSIKPPNDVYLDRRKISGVLVEMRVEATGDYAAIAGIGLNVNQRPEDFPLQLRTSAGSIAMAVGHPVDRQRLAVALLRKMDSRYNSFRPA